MAPVLAGISLFLSLAAFVFFIVGCIGNSPQKGTVKNVNWIHYDHNGLEIWFGLKKVFSQAKGAGDFHAYYNQCNDNDDGFCDTCERTGQAAVGLVAAAVVVSFFSIIASGVSLTNEEAPAKVGAIISSFLAFLFSVIAIGLFMEECYNKINDENYINGKYLHYGPGSIIVTVGFLCMIIAFILNCVNLATGGGSTLASTKA